MVLGASDLFSIAPRGDSAVESEKTVVMYQSGHTRKIDTNPPFKDTTALGRSLEFRIEVGHSFHAPQVLELVFSTLRSFGIEPDPNRWESEIVTFGRNRPTLKEFVAVANDKVIGVGIFEVQKHGLAFFRDLYVDPKYRNLGVGHKLMEHRLAVARACGCTHAMLETRSEFTSAIKLFESTGWKRGPDLRSKDAPIIGPDRTYIRDL